MTRRIASQAPFILLPRYGDRYEGMAKQIRDVIGIARKEARTPEDLEFAEYVASSTVGARMGRAINKRQIDRGKKGRFYESPTLKPDEFWGAGESANPFFLPYKNGFDRTINEYLSDKTIPFKGDSIERIYGVDYRDRLASIAHIPKMMEKWENLPKVQGDVYRGNNNYTYRWEKQDLFAPRFTSASLDDGIARGFAGSSGQTVTIASRSGRRIATKDLEKEVLFAPNTMFRRVEGDDKQARYEEIGMQPIGRIPNYDELKELSENARINSAQNSAVEDFASKAKLLDTPYGKITKDSYLATINKKWEDKMAKDDASYAQYKELAKGMIPKITLNYPIPYQLY